MKSTNMPLRHFFVLATGLAVSAAIGGCSATVGDSVSESAESDLSVGSTLQAVQIHDLGSASIGQAKSESYTGKQRYMGFRVDNIAKGLELEATAQIVTEVSPVVVITDANLKVIAHAVGGAITGAPGRSTVDAQIIAPTKGTYWFLYGEAQRRPFRMSVSAYIRQHAGASCKDDNDCVSTDCKNGTCAASNLSDQCLSNSDCTTSRCTSGHFCDAIPNGDSCNADAECDSTFCQSGTCACVASGQAISVTLSNRCCSRGWTATPFGQCM